MEKTTKKDSVDRLVDILSLYFPPKEVLYVCEMGAKDCADSLRLHEAFPQAEIYSFECNTETLPLCRKVIKGIEKIHLTEKAVSDVDGEICFYPIDTKKTITSHKDGNPGASSMFKASGKYPTETYFQKEIRVPGTRLDTFLEANRLPGIDVLWLDVQGAELKVLEGLGKKLRAVRLIQAEVEFMDIYTGQPLWKDIKKFLKKNGFEFVRFSMKGKYFGDAIFVNRDVATFLGRARRKMIIWKTIAKEKREGLRRRIKRLVKKQ